MDGLRNETVTNRGVSVVLQHHKGMISNSVCESWSKATEVNHGFSCFCRRSLIRWRLPVNISAVAVAAVGFISLSQVVFWLLLEKQQAWILMVTWLPRAFAPWHFFLTCSCLSTSDLLLWFASCLVCHSDRCAKGQEKPSQTLPWWSARSHSLWF